MSDTPTLSAAEADEFRAKCNAFLTEHATGIDIGEGDVGGHKRMAAAKAFQAAAVDAGLAGITYPKGFGGQGLTRAHDRIWREEVGKFPVMTFELTISHGMCLPVLNEFGTDEQKEQFLGDIISAETVWCQMFSEPGAGSDVASLQTKAVLDGEEWIINGQKVWTTLAHLCDYGILIARTDPDVAKHAGISMFIVDMRDPAVEIRPIHQIDGGRHFNEVFFTDLRIPKDWLIPPLHDGWRLATSMLMYERVAIGTGASGGISHAGADRLIKAAQQNGKITDPNIRQELMKVYSQEVAKSLVSMRTRAEMQAGRAPGPGGSLGKLHGAIIAAMARDLGMVVGGLDAQAWDTDDDAGGRWAHQALTSFQASIAGGTDQIQRNIIGDRVLGLPREPSADKGVPFKDLKVGTQTACPVSPAPRRSVRSPTLTPKEQSCPTSSSSKPFARHSGNEVVACRRCTPSTSSVRCRRSSSPARASTPPRLARSSAVASVKSACRP
ncbi:MAG: dehydrogenase [Acidimicrobiales bacterium]|nr:dehydrogenase [Acidimicrobiales bacterium]